MHSLPKPQIDFKNVYESCSKYRDLNMRQRFKERSALISGSVKSYEGHMAAHAPHAVHPLSEEALEPLTKEELLNLYLNRFNKGTLKSRFYDRIIADAKHGVCCWCSYNEVMELDHYLPKSVFPEHGISPVNLLPVCSKCNKRKGDHVPTIGQSFVHPYYGEQVDGVDWLLARVSFAEELPYIDFRVSSDIPSPLKERLEFQFQRLDLAERYRIRAQGIITSRKNQWRRVYQAGGHTALVAMMVEDSDSFRSRCRNDWEGVMFKAMANSEEFCQMKWSDSL